MHSMLGGAPRCRARLVGRRRVRAHRPRFPGSSARAGCRQRRDLIRSDAAVEGERVRALSPSRAGDFMNCPLLYRFRVVDRLPEAPSPAATRGTVVHTVLERLFDLPAAERTLDAAAACSVRRGSRRWPTTPSWLRCSPWRTAGRRARDGARAGRRTGGLAAGADGPAARSYFALEDPTRLEPAERELHVEVALESGLVAARLRRPARRGAGRALRVVDYKTGRAPRDGLRGEGDVPDALLRAGAVAVARRDPAAAAAALPRMRRDGAAYDPDEADLRAMETKVQALWPAIERAHATGDWRPSPSRLCDWCDHQASVPGLGRHTAAAADGADPVVDAACRRLRAAPRARRLGELGLHAESARRGGSLWLGSRSASPEAVPRRCHSSRAGRQRPRHAHQGLRRGRHPRSSRWTRCQCRVRPRPVHRDHGSVRLRQVDADALPAPVSTRPPAARRSSTGSSSTTLATRDLTRLRRDHVGFIFQSFNLRADADRAGEHHTAHGHRRSQAGRRVARHRHRHGRAAGPAAQPAQPAVRRAAAARRRGPSAGRQARDRVRRRAHRQPRLARGRGGPRVPAAQRRRVRPDRRHGHPRPDRGLVRRPGALPRRRSDRRRRCATRRPIRCWSA